MITIIAESARILAEINVYFMALFVGFTPAESHKVTCIAKHESSLNPNAVNVNKNKSKDHGLMQINDLWHETCKDLDLYDELDNLVCTKRIYEASKKSFWPWIAYRKHKDKCDAYEVQQCAPPLINDETNLTELIDNEALARAQYTCQTRYHKCLKTFTRIGSNDYRAICGV